MTKSLALGLLFLIGTSAWAGYQQSDLSYSTNEDHIHLTRFTLTAAPDHYDLLWPYENEGESIVIIAPDYEHGFGTAPEVAGSGEQSYHYDALAIRFEKKFSKTFSFEGKAGAFDFRNKTLDSELKTSVYSAGVLAQVSSSLWAGLSLERSFLIQEGALVGAITSPLSALSLKERLNYQTSERLKFQESYRHRWFGDSNSRNDVDVSSMYGLSLYPTWFWLGLGASYSDFASQSLSYWSPTSVFTVGLQFDLSVPVTDRLAFKLGGTVGSTKESSADSSISNYIKSALVYGQREKSVEIYFIDSRSTRADGDWSGQTTGLHFNSNF